MVKCKHLHPNFDDEVLRLRVSDEIGNHQPLMHVIGDMQFAFNVSVALSEFIRRGNAFNCAGRAV